MENSEKKYATKEELKSAFNLINEIDRKIADSEGQGSGASVVVDSIPTQNSQNAVSSGGVFSTLASKQDVLTAGTNITIQNGTISASVDTSSLQSQITSQGTDIHNLQLQASANTSNIVSLQTNKQNKLTAGTGITISEQNVISASGCNCASSILALQNSVAEINQQISNIKNYVGYEDIVYDQTIVTNSDLYERDVEITGSNIVYGPSVLFVTEKRLTSTDEQQNVVEYPNPIVTNAQITVIVDAIGDYTFSVYDKSTIIKSVTVTFENGEANTEKTITIDSSVFNALENHTYYVAVQAEDTSTTKTITITHFRLLVSTPNATILNKINPFDVTFNYYTNKYYLSDCSTGYAKLAEIDANDLHSINDIVWTQTNIEAQNYKTFFINSLDNSGTTLGNRYASIVHKNDTLTVVDITNNTTLFTAPRGTYKLSPVITTHNYTQFYIYTVSRNTIQCRYYNIYQDGSTKTNSQLTSDTSLANIECARNNQAYLPSNAWATCIAVKTDSSIQFYNITTKLNSQSVDFVSDVKIYFDKRATGKNYPYYYCYYKRFGTYYKYYVYYASSTCSVQQSPTAIGQFDDLFECPNGDYFVVQNNTLQYLSSLPQEE